MGIIYVTTNPLNYKLEFKKGVTNIFTTFFLINYKYTNHLLHKKITLFLGNYKLVFLLLSASCNYNSSFFLIIIRK